MTSMHVPHPALRPFPRIRLGHLPTPFEPHDRLAAAVGLSSLLVKRDDCTGLGAGGNKVRKLEFLLGAALEAGIDTVVTGGGVQSNHAQQAAAAAARLGVCCHLVLAAPQAYDGTSYRENGNRLLDDLLGAQVCVVHAGADLNHAIIDRADQLTAEGRRACAIPVGGSNGRGALGYVAAGLEIADDLRRCGKTASRIVLATGSGGTQAGLLLGLALANLDVPVDGISVGSPKVQQLRRVTNCLSEVEMLLGCVGRVSRQAIRVHDGYVGAAYGDPTIAMIKAVRLAGGAGLLLDPVYTGKAMAGLLDLTARGVIAGNETVLFLHTGGAASLFAYDAAFRSSGANERRFHA
jgi:L-cysteate sulfo-lyase